MAYAHSHYCKEWVADSCTLQKIDISGDTFMSLVDETPPPTDYSSSLCASEDIEEEEISLESDKDLKRALYSMFLMDVDGNLTLFGDLVNGKTTLLFFLRHFGW
jgi:hypothetical protein